MALVTSDCGRGRCSRCGPSPPAGLTQPLSGATLPFVTFPFSLPFAKPYLARFAALPLPFTARLLPFHCLFQGLAQPRLCHRDRRRAWRRELFDRRARRARQPAAGRRGPHSLLLLLLVVVVVVVVLVLVMVVVVDVVVVVAVMVVVIFIVIVIVVVPALLLPRGCSFHWFYATPDRPCWCPAGWLHAVH